ncbi:MAG: hypothetical protein AAFZ07_28885 [Actinomycetota bacterium]
MTATSATPTLRRRPIRGVIYGLLVGLGVALILIDRAVIALGTLTPIVCVLVGGVLGFAWAWFGPARDPGPPPPTSTDPPSDEIDPPPPEASPASDPADGDGS